MRSEAGRRIYIASSWKNSGAVRDLAIYFREQGHQVFDFTDIDNRPEGLDKFVFHASQWLGKALSEIDWLEFLASPATTRAFRSDKAGLDWADTVVLVVPSGRSSHLEAGYGVGQGKDLFIWGDLPLGEFDAMYGFAKGCFRASDLSKLIKVLNDKGEKVGGGKL